ncbi:MAG: glycosyltransferase family 9 protein [Ignavibacteriales bacterium]|nr:glycosyltransferase family 9 protein [Ignavibacteriales bacterium]
MIQSEKKITKILIIKLRGIGDVVQSTLILDSLVSSFPGSEIDYLTDYPSVDFLSKIPIVNSVLIFPRKELLKRVKLFYKIFRGRYDLVIDLFSNPASAQATFFSRAKYRLGFPYRGRKYAYNIYGPENRAEFHTVDLNIELIKKIVHFTPTSRFYFGLTERDRSEAKIFFNNNFQKTDKIIGICPSGGWASKRCDPIKFAEISDFLISEYSVKVIIIWGPEDKTDALEITEKSGMNLVLAPPTSISSMGAYLENCNMVIANDSGPMHIAVAVGTPVLALFGPTNPKFHGPYGEKHAFIQLSDLECINCNLLNCPLAHECFNNIPVEKIKPFVDNYLK